MTRPGTTVGARGHRLVTELSDFPSLLGRELVGDWLQVDAERERQFYNGTYLDRTYGETVGDGYPDGMVEGFQTLALLDYLSSQLVGRWYGFNYGLDRVRFVAPVTTSDQIRLRLTIAGVEPRDDGFLVTYDAVVELHGQDRPALVARWLVLLLPEPAGRPVPEPGRDGSLYGSPDIVRENRPDGSVLMRSAEPLADHPVSVLHSFRSWVGVDPDHVLVAERDADGGWRTLSYGRALAEAEAVGQALLDRGLGPDRPLMVLSGNSVDHLVVTLAAMTAGIPVAPTSVAYSLQSKDHGRLREIAAMIGPGAVYAEDADQFSAALDAVGTVPTIVSRGRRKGAEPLAGLKTTAAGAAVRNAFARIEPGSVAKILFTSGSTGAPKGVLTTHGMLAANQQMIRQVWPFLTRERPVIVDWLPWSHTFGGNHNLGMMLVAGGTLYIDAGRPAPGMFDQTLANLTDVPPTVYFNVPAGYAQLVPALENDPELARRFFSRLRLVFNAAASLPDTLRQRLSDVALRTTGRTIPVTGSWGLTETAPAVTTAHFEYTDTRSIGVPLPGTEVLLNPVEDAYEILARGPMVTPGYLGRPDLTATAFDEDGFYRTGDAVTFADEGDPNLGLVFCGRLAEDFKLTTGTFVRVAAVRTSLLSAIPVLSDAVIAGEDRDYVSALAWLNAAEARKLLGRDVAADGDVYTDPGLVEHVAAALDTHRASTGSAGRVERLLVMSRPADLDVGEVTDKGYVNQRKVLQSRAALVDLLYDEPEPPGLVRPARKTTSRGTT